MAYFSLIFAHNVAHTSLKSVIGKLKMRLSGVKQPLCTADIEVPALQTALRVLMGQDHNKKTKVYFHKKVLDSSEIPTHRLF